MPNNLINNITKLDNLLWAWKKAKKAYTIGDVWFDPIELSSFEANLNDNLNQIKNDIENGQYKLANLRPIPYPKSFDTDKQVSRVRQTFYVRVRDQVTWIAVVNVIGPDLDYQMPFWSYGNRLFVSGWYDNEDDPNKRWHVGWYRNSKGNIYKTWKQSWPRYIHNVALTCKVMSSTHSSYTKEDKKELEDNKNLKGNFNVEYFTPGYWPTEATTNVLYWASIDLKKFYPSVKRDVVRQNITKYHNDELIQSDEFQQLLSALLSFELDISGWTPADIVEINEPKNCITGTSFNGIPTGLFVAGFLCNVAMLEVDKEVSCQLSSKKDIAVFKYVDDHIILAYSLDSLAEWIVAYENLVKSKKIGVEVNPSKTDPVEVMQYIDGAIDKKNAERKCQLDPSFPSPLMTQTLTKISGLGSTDLEFLDEAEEQQLIADLEHLLLTDFPDHEIKKDTRVSFAAGMLARIVPRRVASYDKVYSIRKEIHRNVNSVGEIRNHHAIKRLKSALSDKYLFDLDDKAKHIDIACCALSEDNEDKSITAGLVELIKEKLLSIDKELNKLKLSLRAELASIHEKEEIERSRTYNLIRKATKENYDKLKLWRRIIDYCYNTELNKYDDIRHAIEELDNEGQVHRLVLPFLYSTLIYLISEKLLHATKIRINSKIEDRQSKIFIQSILSKEFLDPIFELETLDEKGYYKNCFCYFKSVLGSIAHILFIEKEQSFSFIYSYDIINWSCNPKEWILKNQGNRGNDLLFYLLSNCSIKTNNTPNKYWRDLTAHIDYSTRGAQPLVQGFPMLCKKESLLKDDGFIYDFHYLQASISYEAPTLYDWVKWCGAYKSSDSINSSEHLYDPRLSEWFALNITRTIAQIIADSLKKSPEEYFGLTKADRAIIYAHPANFIVPPEWIKNDNMRSWEYWRRDFNDSGQLSRIRVNETISIIDNRYYPEGISEQYDASDLRHIHSLAVILISLLSHDLSFPWLWNAGDGNVEWNMLLISKLNDVPVSSYTRNILQACLWDKNRETKYWIRQKRITIKGYIDNDDTLNDPPVVDGIEDMIAFLGIAIDHLEDNQLSVGVDKPRQLIPISLKQLSKSKTETSSDTHGAEENL